MNYQDLIRKAEASLAQGNLDQAEALLDYVTKAQADEEDEADGGYNPHESNPSLDVSDDDDDETDDDEDDGDTVDKALRTLRKADKDIIARHVNMSNTMRTHGHPRARGYDGTADPYATAVMKPPEGPGKRHKFIARAEHIRERDGVSRAESLTRARQEFPETYTDYQDHLVRRTTRRQHMVRGWDRVGKAAPDTFQDLCAAELKKSAGSLTHEMAAQRVCQQFGFRAFDHEMYKGESKLTERFEKRVNRLNAEGYDGETACRLVRQADPLLFKAMQLT
jgi:hypothetical protein